MLKIDENLSVSHFLLGYELDNVFMQLFYIPFVCEVGRADSQNWVRNIREVLQGCCWEYSGWTWTSSKCRALGRKGEMGWESVFLAHDYNGLR